MICSNFNDDFFLGFVWLYSFFNCEFLKRSFVDGYLLVDASEMRLPSPVSPGPVTVSSKRSFLCYTGFLFCKPCNLYIFVSMSSLSVNCALPLDAQLVSSNLSCNFCLGFLPRNADQFTGFYVLEHTACFAILCRPFSYYL